MKKLTAVLLTLLFAYIGIAQGYFRVQVGPVFNYLRAEGNIGSFSNLNTGITGGISYEMMAGKHFSIQPELNYTHLHTTESSTTTDQYFDYVQIPVLLKAVSSQRNFSFYLGPQLGFLTKGTNKASGIKTDITNNLTETDFGGVIGIEYVLPVNITINARFTQGFSNVYKVEFGSPNTTRHEIIGLTIGYLFGKKK